MKKSLSMILALVMLLTLALLAACNNDDSDATDPPATSPTDAVMDPADDGGNSETVSIGGLKDVVIETPADGTKTYNGLTEAELDASLPREYAAEKLAAGKEVLVAYCLNEFSGDDVTKRVNGLMGSLEQLGFTVGTTDAGQDAAVEISQIENYVTMGATYIQCVVASISSFEDVAKYAMENGTYIGFWGQTPKFDAAGVYAFDQKDLGNQCGYMASEWVDMMFPDAGEGEVHAALLGNERNDDVTLRTNSIREAFEENSKVEITFYVIERLGTDVAYTAAEEALTTDPTIKVFLTFAPSQAIGVSNFVTAQPVDIAEYGVFSCTEDATLISMINEAAAGGNSICRGTVGYDCENLWDAEYKLITDLLFLDAETPHFVYDNLKQVRAF